VWFLSLLLVPTLSVKCHGSVLKGKARRATSTGRRYGPALLSIVEIADSTYRAPTQPSRILTRWGMTVLVVAVERRSRNTASVFAPQDQMARRRVIRLNHLNASHDAVLVSGEVTWGFGFRWNRPRVVRSVVVRSRRNRSWYAGHAVPAIDDRAQVRSKSGPQFNSEDGLLGFFCGRKPSKENSLADPQAVKLRLMQQAWRQPTHCRRYE